MAKVLNHLKEIRKRKGLALYGLVALSGISYPRLSAIERWGLYPSLSTRDRIADALGVEKHDIWPGDDPDEVIAE